MNESILPHIDSIKVEALTDINLFTDQAKITIKIEKINKKLEIEQTKPKSFRVQKLTSFGAFPFEKKNCTEMRPL